VHAARSVEDGVPQDDPLALVAFAVVHSALLLRLNGRQSASCFSSRSLRS
jgi:hypothetical protein